MAGMSSLGLVLSVGLLFTASVVSAQRSCQYHQGLEGVCKDISQCPIVIEHLRNGIAVPIFCGFFNRRNPVVCCPSGGGGPSDPSPSTDISEPSPPVDCGTSTPIRDELIEASRQQATNRNNEVLATRGSVPLGSFAPDFPPERDDLIMHVVGGIPSFRNAWPWMALLGFRDNAGNNDWFCAGTLINSQYVLTAAHCFNDLKVNVVRLGEYDYENPRDGASPEDFDVGAPIIFPNYTSFQAYHDLALLKLHRQIPRFSNSIRPVCLPWGSEVDRNLENEKVTLTGWGRTQFMGSRSPSLLEVEVTVFPSDQCDKNYQTLADYTSTWPQGIGSESICSGDENGGKDACQGDSGGPIVSKDSKGRFIIAGVVSLGNGCGDVNYPGLYVNVRTPEYLAWIKKVAFSRP